MQNPLNNFKSYTYHFALFVNHDGTKIEEITTFPTEHTTRTAGVESLGSTLLVNSVTDPFQIIDDVNFTYFNSHVNTGQPLVAGGELTMRVIEPGNCMFMSKIKNAMTKHKVSKPSFFVFGLKIKFVGIDGDNNITVIDDEIPIIPMILADMRATYDHRGSEYNLKFAMIAFGAASTSPSQPHSELLGKVPQTITFKATTLAGAIGQFQDQLNSTYKQILEKETQVSAIRKITYTINLPGELAGCDIKSAAVANTTASTDYHFSIQAMTQIPKAINDLILSSPDAANIVKDSASGFKKELHAGAKLWSIMPKLIYREGEVELLYDVKWYDGGNIEKFEFDFYFSDKPNVDVIAYEVVFAQSTLIYLSSAYDANLDANLKTSNSTDSKSTSFETNSITPNKKVEEQKLNQVLTPVIGESNDIVGPQSVPKVVLNAMSGTRTVDVAEKKSALNAMAAAMSADFAQKVLKIRGTTELLKRCVASTSQTSFGIEGGIWIKVNVFAQDDETGARIPYYYQGWYNLIAVQSSFRDGKFEQELTLVMMFDGAKEQ